MDGKPKLYLEKPQYSLGEKLRANCSSPPSNPPANITWFINDKEVRTITRYNNKNYTTKIVPKVRQSLLCYYTYTTLYYKSFILTENLRIKK